MYCVQLAVMVTDGFICVMSAIGIHGDKSCSHNILAASMLHARHQSTAMQWLGSTNLGQQSAMA